MEERGAGWHGDETLSPVPVAPSPFSCWEGEVIPELETVAALVRDASMPHPGPAQSQQQLPGRNLWGAMAGAGGRNPHGL